MLLRHSAVVAAVSGLVAYLGNHPKMTLGPGDSMLSYLPLAHIFDRVAEVRRVCCALCVLCVRALFFVCCCCCCCCCVRQLCRQPLAAAIIIFKTHTH